MEFFRRLTFLVCAPAFDNDDLEGVRVQQIITQVEHLGFEVVRARRIDDAEIAVQTDAARLNDRLKEYLLSITGRCDKVAVLESENAKLKADLAAALAPKK